MRKGSSKSQIVCLDQYTMKEVGRWPSVNVASKELEIPSSSIYVALCIRKAAYDCYWVYASNLSEWEPAPVCHRRVREVKTSQKLQELINKMYESKE